MKNNLEYQHYVCKPKRAKYPKGTYFPAYRPGDLALVPVRKLWVLAHIDSVNPLMASFGDFQAEYPELSIFTVLRSQVSKDIGKMIGSSFVSPLEAEKALRPFRVTGGAA